ncbi:hypothetical protein pb186bvf_018972 [Paramecium bursaria]
MSDTATLIVRIFNAISAVVLIFAGSWIFFALLFESKFNVWAMFGPFFFILFGFLLVANELGQDQILDEFGFLKTFLGRGLFYIFLAGMVIHAYDFISQSVIPGDIYGSILFGLGILYLLMNFIVIDYINFQPDGHIGNLSRSLQIQ